MGMNYGNKIITSIKGRRLGLAVLSSGETGSAKKLEFLVGPDAFRGTHSSVETTSTNLSAMGVSVLASAPTSGVYTLDPPILGCEKTLIFNTTGLVSILVKTANAETIQTTQSSSATTIISSQGAQFALRLVAHTTAAWTASLGLTTAFVRMTTTT